jgi:hypothetical protein
MANQDKDNDVLGASPLLVDVLVEVSVVWSYPTDQTTPKVV